jgi:next-to-BRCA1 protein 1
MPATQIETFSAEEDNQEQLHRIFSEHAKNTTAEDGKTAAERSSMVFPKLDRESPASSAYQCAIMSSRGKATYV